MEYVFGLDDRRGQRTLLTKGGEHTALSGFCEVVRAYDDCTITDSFYAARKTKAARTARARAMTGTISTSITG